MVKVSNEGYVNLSDERINSIVSVLNELDYFDTDFENRICPHVAQWLYDKGVTIESTCLIISEIINISALEKKIQEIYEGIIPPFAKSELKKFLTDEEYHKLEKVIDNQTNINPVYRGEIDDSTYLIINYKTKQVIQGKKSNKKDTMDKLTPIIEAVPKRLIVYDSAITDQPRNFKVTWTSPYSERDFTVTGEGIGADIGEIASYILKSGYSHNPKLVEGALSCMINTLIDKGVAEIRTDIDNLGVYFNQENESVVVVKLDFSKPSNEEMLKAIELLEKVSTFFLGNEEVFASVFKWGLMSVFSYAMKQVGNKLPWLYLKGTSQSGKTTLAKISLYIYGVPSSENNIGGASFNTEFRIGNKLSQDCTTRVVNEPASVFNRDASKELVKVSVESITARKIQGKVYPAFSPVIFTANQYLPNDDALLNRFFVLGFTYNQRKTDEQKQAFKEAFHIDTPSMSNLTLLSIFGRFAINEIVSDPSRLFDDWQKTANFIVNKFYATVGVPCPKWLDGWADNESVDDFDISQREAIRNFFVDKFNIARSKVDIRNEYGRKESTTLEINQASTSDDFSDLNWEIVNNRMITWAIPHTTRWNERNICLTQGLREDLNKSLEYSNDLKSLGELLGWDYKNVKINGTQMRVLKVKFDDFMSFLYPTVSSGNDEES